MPKNGGVQRRSPCRGYGRSSPEYELGTNTLLYLIKLPEVIADLALIPLIFFAPRRSARAHAA